MQHTNRHSTGFTIVELIVVIVVIGILAAITIVAYKGATKHSAETVMQHDLLSALTLLESQRTHDRALDLTADFTSSQNVVISFVPPTPRYNGLSPVQNGILLSSICQSLVDEGKGRGLNKGGGSDTYVIGCGNWNNDSMQITGWTSKVFATPIASTAFTGYASSVPAGDSYHPNQQGVIQQFYTMLDSRFLAAGGSYPITSFWDSWATSSNGGVQYQPLPAPTAIDTSHYCVQASHTTYVDVLWHITPDSKPSQGAC